MYEESVGFLGLASSIDTDMDGRIIIPNAESYAFPDKGKITSIEVERTVGNMNNPLQVAFQVWRPASSPRFTLVYETAYYESRNQEKFTIDVPSYEPMIVQKGDVFGLKVQGQNPIPYVNQRSCNSRDQLL